MPVVIYFTRCSLHKVQKKNSNNKIQTWCNLYWC